MSEKTSCPICGDYGSWIYRGEDCSAGCTQEMRSEVNAIRSKVGDEKLKAALEEATIRVVKFKEELALLRWRQESADRQTEKALEYLRGARDGERDPWS